MSTETDTTEKEYPQCERWAAAHEKASVIREFLDWMASEAQPPLVVCKAWDSGDYLPELSPNKLDSLLMQFFKVDANAIDKERRAMLEECRKLNASTTDNTTSTETAEEVVVGEATASA